MKIDKKVKARTELLHKNQAGYRASSNLHFIYYLLGLLAVMLALRAFVFEPIRVEGESMQNTLQDQEYCFAGKASYWFRNPKPGDIVIVYYTNYDKERNRPRQTYVKRVIAVGGQTVCVVPAKDKGASAKVYVDGAELDESAYEGNFKLDANRLYNTIASGAEGGEYREIIDGTEVYYECTVKEGYVFVMGDHRTDSHDSRASDVGPIPLHDVIGRVRLAIDLKAKSARLVG